MVIALVFLGPKRLPEAGRQVGRAIREFRSITAGVQQELRDALPMDDIRAAMPLDELRQLADMRNTLTRELTNTLDGVSSSPGTSTLATGTLSLNKADSAEIPSLRAEADQSVKIGGMAFDADEVEQALAVRVDRGIDVVAPDGHAAEIDSPSVTAVVDVPAPGTAYIL